MTPLGGWPNAPWPTQLIIRPAREDDCLFVYSLSMDPIVRENSTRSDKFTYGQHKKWWAEKMSNGLNAIYILEVNGAPVGQCRYGRVQVDCESCPDTPSRHCCKWEAEKQAEVAISVFPSLHGKGLGKHLLTETMPLACEQLHVSTLIALVLRNNRASRRLFRGAGFRYVGLECRLDKSHVRYEWAQK